MIDKKINEVNQRLKAGNICLKIQRQGQKLYLRGIFPPKEDEGDISKNEALCDRTWHQQRLALKVGATPAGLKYAEAKAKEISALLDLKQFSWDKYISKPTENLSISDVLGKLEKDYFSTRNKSQTTLNTWQKEYYKPLIALPQNKKITIDILKQHIFTTTPNSRIRRRYALACAKLADFLGLEHNLRKLVGNYGIKSLSPRCLPSDATIANLINNFGDLGWRWVYGIMACYGVRNHEVFALDLHDYPIAFINRGKTGERYTWALFPEWAEEWNLKNMILPKVAGKTNTDLGNRVTKAFKRNNIPFSPYNLRHAWAVRSGEACHCVIA